MYKATIGEEWGPLPLKKSRKGHEGRHLCRYGCVGGKHEGGCGDHGHYGSSRKYDHSDSHGDSLNLLKPEP